MKRKKILLLTSSLVMVGLLVALGVSIAFMSVTTAAKSNPFTKGTPGIDITENSHPTASSTNEVPYSQKEVRATNTGSIAEYVRVMLVPSYKFENGTASSVRGLSFTTMPTLIASNAKFFTMGDLQLNLADHWGDKWFYVYDANDKIGYFYYNEKLNPGATTSQPLLKSVGIASGSSAVTSALLTNLQVDVIADSIQADGGAVTDVWGNYVVEDTIHRKISKK